MYDKNPPILYSFLMDTITATGDRTKYRIEVVLSYIFHSSLANTMNFEYVISNFIKDEILDAMIQKVEAL